MPVVAFVVEATDGASLVAVVLVKVRFCKFYT